MPKKKKGSTPEDEAAEEAEAVELAVENVELGKAMPRAQQQRVRKSYRVVSRGSRLRCDGRACIPRRGKKEVSLESEYLAVQ
jgi:hypothetical protein